MHPGRLSLNLVLPFCLFFPLLDLAQDRCPPAASQQGVATFGANVTVVTVPVVVRDTKGRVIEGLAKEDFQIFDKRKRQTISSFSVSENDAAAHAEAPATAPLRDHPGVAPAAEQILKPAVGNPRLAGRYVAYLFDDRDVEFPDLVAVRKAALRHFKTTPATDHSAIYTFSGRTTLEFTSDKDKLADAVKKLSIQSGQGHDAGKACPDVSYYLADLIVQESQFPQNKNAPNVKDERALDAATRQTMQCLPADEGRARWLALSQARKEISILGPQDTRVALDALKATIRRMAEVSGPRLIVLASPGFFPRTADERRHLGEVLDLAARNNVIISALDVRGVHVLGHDDASQGIPSTSVEEQYYLQSSLAMGDVLEDLARGTGGTLFRRNNDLTTGFARVTSTPRIHYVLGFSPEDLKADGSFHSLKVRVPNRRGLNIEARNGYFAAQGALAKETPEEAIHDAVFSREELDEIPMDVAAQVSRSGTSSAKLLVVAKVFEGCLHFRKLDGRNDDSLTIVYALFDDQGGYVEGNSKTVNFALRDETLANDAGVDVQSGFVMKPGTYLARVVVRDAGAKAISARNVTITVR